MKQLLAVLIALLFAAGAALAADPPKCVDVETATAKDLTALKGVGPALAKKIIDHRKKERSAATKAKKPTWNFKNWATLMKVPGVGPQICQDNLALVCFSGKVQKACPKAVPKAKK